MAEVAPNRAARAAIWSGIGGLLASAGAFATWFCCIPVVAGAASGLAAVASLAWEARPWLLAAAGVFLALGFWYAYRPEPCPEGAVCALPARRRRARILLWISTAIAVMAFTFPQWSSWLYLAFL
jgi:mercuric ion transport protein